MKDFHQKIKRQTELLGLILSGDRIDIADAADIFGCEQVTIKRDLADIRSYGIDIHSNAKKGIIIDEPLDEEQVRQILSQYLYAFVSKEYDKSFNLLLNKLKQNSIPIITTIQRGLERRRSVVIEYKKEESLDSYQCSIDPIMFFQSGGRWRILAKNDNKVKQFIIEKIIKAEITKKRFDKIPIKEVESLFAASFKSWLGPEKYEVKLRFYEPWTDFVVGTTMMANQRLHRNKDGSCDLEMTVNSLIEVAGWIVSRGKGVVVLEPEELKTQVIELANGCLQNY